MHLAEKTLEEPPDLRYADITERLRREGIFRYNDGIPILPPENSEFDIFNPGAAKFKNEYILIARFEKKGADFSDLFLLRSENGIYFDINRREPIPFGNKVFTKRGREDARINAVNGGFAISFTTFTKEIGSCVGLVYTEDFKSYEDKGIIFPSANKNVVIFPEKIDNQYFLFHRPTDSKSIFSARGPDRGHWGEHQIILEPGSAEWCQDRVGAGAPLIKTAEGWLSIVHGVNRKRRKYVYRAGTLLTALDDPARFLRISQKPILVPETGYEKGKKKNVVFPTAAILEENEGFKFARIYYGSGDRCTCMAFASLDYLIEHALYN